MGTMSSAGSDHSLRHINVLTPLHFVCVLFEQYRFHEIHRHDKCSQSLRVVHRLSEAYNVHESSI